MSNGDRTKQHCDLCGLDDWDPRHSSFNPSTGVSVTAHFDCCSGAGCPVCAELLDGIPLGHRHGQKLIDWVTSPDRKKDKEKA